GFSSACAYVAPWCAQPCHRLSLRPDCRDPVQGYGRIHRRLMDNERAYSSAKRWGWTLIELLAVTFMIAAPATAWLSVSARHGTGWGSVAAFATGSLSFIVVALFYWLMWRLDERALQK